ncbi:SMC-Scp complex subunit ScpB [Fluctibacter halophilus]|uniref:SMC-Scp complex subunit ScpB n=1 Tax=Fluctibacter halophilus TaxID=226011 RepID=UPI00226CF0D5|nr:SMC-Scp complex subunit ScpB [Aestuariibacter halophilus]
MFVWLVERKSVAKIARQQLKQLVEATLFVADGPVSKAQMLDTVLVEFSVSNKVLDEILQELVQDYQSRGVQLVEVASGYRFQSMDSLSPWLSRLWQEHAPRYSRALMETLALIAYRQPITRGEIEDVRGVAVSSHIVKTLTERGWVKVVGHKEVPGRPALLATTKAFLDYFGLRSLAELPAAETFEAMLSGDDDEGQATDNNQDGVVSSDTPSTNQEQLH